MSETYHRNHPFVSKSSPELTNIYSQLTNRLTNLQNNSNLLSEKLFTNYHQFLLSQLQLLLTTHKSHALANLRTAYVSITQLSTEAPKDIQIRITNFGRALLWTLDHAEHLLSLAEDLGDTGELQLMKAISTIFHHVEKFSNQEWGFQPSSSDDIHAVMENDSTVVVPSNQDPVYHPPPRVRSTSATPHLTRDLYSDQIVQIDESSAYPQNNNSALLPCGSHYILGEGKLIMPDACLQETPKGCVVPFEVLMNDCKGQTDGVSVPPLRVAHVLYPDLTCFDHLPVQNIRILHPHSSVHNSLQSIAEGDSLAQPMVAVEISSLIYATILHLCQHAYNHRFPEAHVFLPDLLLTIPESREVVKMPVTTDCFVRVVDSQKISEHRLSKALDVYRKNLCGCGLIHVEFVEKLDGTKIVMSLAGIVVELPENL